jgi:hypothetical protein
MPVKALLRKTYELPAASLLRRIHLNYISKKESFRTRQICLEMGFQELTKEGLRSIPKTAVQRCFILGSGSTVNELRDEDYREIKKGFSIGINAWVSHRFTPDAYSFEADGLDEAPSGEIVAMSEALVLKAKENPRLALFLLRPKRVGLQKRMVRVPATLTNRSFMYGRYNLVTRNPENLGRDLDLIIARAEKAISSQPVIVDNGASVSRLVTLCALMGFAEIVLVGVDLSANPYFWQESGTETADDALRASYPRGFTPRHDTLETENRPFSNQAFLIALSASVRDHFGARVLVGSPRSSLASDLPLFEWSRVNTPHPEGTVN